MTLEQKLKEIFGVDADYAHYRCVLAAIEAPGSGYTRLAPETPQDKLAHDLLISMMAEWIAIEHDKTRLQASEYLTEAQELYDYLFVIGFRNDRDTNTKYARLAPASMCSGRLSDGRLAALRLVILPEPKQEVKG